MKYTKHILTVSTIALFSTIASAEDYTTGCQYTIEGDRTSYKFKTAQGETITSFEEENLTPRKCVEMAATAVKQKYTTKFLIGGSFKDTTYRNKSAKINIVHNNNVAFPKHQLETAITKDSCLTLKNGFKFVESWIGEDHYTAEVQHVTGCNN